MTGHNASGKRISPLRGGIITGMFLALLSAILSNNFIVGILSGYSFGLGVFIILERRQVKRLTRRESGIRIVLIFLALLSLLMILIWVLGKMFYMDGNTIK